MTCITLTETYFKFAISHGPKYRPLMKAFASDSGRLYADCYTSKESRIISFRYL